MAQLDVSKASAYSVVGPPQGSVSKALAYAVLSTEITIGVSKGVCYAVLLPYTESFETTTALMADNTLVTSGAPVVFTATVSAGTGMVTFRDGLTVMGSVTLVDKQAVFTTSTLTMGAHDISVTYEGDGTYLPSTSNFVSVTVIAARGVSKATAYAVLSTEITIGVSKGTGYAVVKPPQGSVSKAVGYAVLESKTITSVLKVRVNGVFQPCPIKERVGDRFLERPLKFT